MRILTCWQPRAVALAAVLAAAAAAPASANVPVTQVSADPFSNNTSQHATELEPDTFANGGGTLISTFQVGRFFNGGASDIGWARRDSLGNWTSGFLPGMTQQTDPANNTYERVSDPSVAYDAQDGVWLISSIPLKPGTLQVPTVFINRSTDDGQTWSNPISMPPPAVSPKKLDLDKNWTACDNTPTSPHYGNCYTEFDNFGEGDLEYMSTSTDGGVTWSTPASTAGNDKGLGGQPLVQPNGNVIVPFESLNGKIAAFKSTDGGATWSKAVTIGSAQSHGNSGGLRTSPLPTAEIDGAGNVYVAWQDCRFRKSCSSNDIVFSKSSNGVSWSPVARIPIDSVTSGADHFIPGLAVNTATSGSSADLALTYYFYPDAACTPSTCVLQAGTISSPDGGANWGGTDTVGPSMTLDKIAATSQGRMVGDYISTSFLQSGAYETTVAIGKAPTGGRAFDEGMYAPTTPLTVATSGLTPAQTSGAHQFTGQGTGETHHALRND
ncbi:MAG: exo-alpha-sialidase [Actinobacteria bacterium]|nr:MAG: exo-alpha-sialidase [Actinomycetota bacterium]